MASESSSDREALRRALAPGKDCLPIEKLEGLSEDEISRHVQFCAYCRTELELLRMFQAGPRDATEAAAILQVAARLKPVLPPVADEAPPWWKGLFKVRWLSPAAVAMAGVLILVAVSVELRHSGAPNLSAPNSSQEVLRSGAFNVLSPVGDIGEAPKEVRWQTVAGAARYEVRLLEVDRQELWSITTAQPQIEIPREVQAKIVPSKTLLLRVTAFDGAGRKIVESETVRFRVLQNLYTR